MSRGACARSCYGVRPYVNKWGSIDGAQYSNQDMGCPGDFPALQFVFCSQDPAIWRPQYALCTALLRSSSRVWHATLGLL